MGKGLRRRVAAVFSWIFILPTISSTFWLPMWIALTLVLPTIFNYFPETPSPLRMAWIPQWFFRILYVAWMPLTLIPGSDWVTEFLYLPEIWTNTWLSLFLGLVSPWVLAGGLFLFLAGLVQLLWSKYRGAGLVAKGFYSFVRHPQYLGIFVWIFGHVLYSLPLHLRPADLLAWVSLVFLYIIMARNEERNLQRKFGEKYENYRRSVPFLIPFTPYVVSKKLKRVYAIQERHRALVLVSVYVVIVISILGLSYGRTYVEPFY